MENSVVKKIVEKDIGEIQLSEIFFYNSFPMKKSLLKTKIRD
jgi:hypothetical protein